MGFLAVVEQGARAYPALLPLVLISIALTLWACERKRWFGAAALSTVGLASCILYVFDPARGFPPSSHARTMTASAPGQVLGATETTSRPVPSPAGAYGKGRAIHPLLQPRRFSSSVRLHPRFPQDFPIPVEFRLESNSGGTSGGVLTVRFRFTGEAPNAVCDLRSLGRRSGWGVEILAPHRMIFRKDGREIEAWFSFPARSVVLDIPDAR